MPTALKSQPVPEGGQTTSKDGAADQGQKSEPAPEKLSPSLDRIEAAIRDLVAQERAAQDQGPKDNEIRDLEAQEGMALWAKAMFWATVAAVILTFTGIFLIWRTLHHTRRAANYAEGMLSESRETTKAARDAVDEAKAATKAAEDAVEVTRDTAKRQLRAYVHPIYANLLMKEDGYIKGSVTIKNAGQTPAYWFESRCTLTFSPNLLFSDTPDIEHVGERRSGSTIQPKGTVDASSEALAKLVPEYLSKLAARELAIFLHGRLTYRDTFGSSRTTNFRYIYVGPWGGQKPLEICGEGNEAT